jgi:DNA recombination protein RmuC
VCVGAGIVLLILHLRKPSVRALAQELVERTEANKLEDLQAIIDKVKVAFGTLSQESLKSNSEDFLRLAETRLTAQTKQGEGLLESKKKLIDESLKQLGARVNEVSTALQTLDKDRRESHGSLVKHLETTTRTTAELHRTTAELREALANPQRRGQWGERMADDVLRLVGFVEGVNYQRHSQTAAGRRPDFTFPLPEGRHVNMDVKFPLANYLRYLDADDESAREQFKTSFLRDVRSRIKEVTTRDYIDPDAGTVDYVLVFIPNEQIYGCVHECDPTLLDDALKQKVVLCAPLTLYAILAVIRQTAEHVRLERASREILTLLESFRKQWTKYVDLMEKMGGKLDEARSCFDDLRTTRTRQLDRQLDKIEELRTREQVPLLSDSEQ